MPNSCRIMRAFTLMEMVMVLVVVGLLLSIIVPKFTGIRDEAQEIFVIGTLKGVAIASETFAKDHDGHYPTNSMDLIAAVPPYLQRDICGTTEAGYVFTCVFMADGYSVTAAPVTLPGTSWTIITGGELLSTEM